jgi:hypothetical protein
MLLALLLSVITFGSPVTPPGGFTGYAIAPVPAANLSCAPGQVCATTTINFYGCYAVNAYTGSVGGSPLAIDLTQNGPKTVTHVFWVNNTNKAVTVKSSGYAYYYCAGKT